MKLTIICVLLMLSFSGNAQQSCLLSGKVLLPQQRYIVLMYQTNSGFEAHTDTIQLNADNRFNYTWKFDPPYGSAELKVSQRFSLYIWAHDNGELDMQIGDSVKKTIFSGNLAKYNRYLNIQAIKDWRAADAKYYARFISNKNEEEVGSDSYFSIEDSILSERMRLLNDAFPGGEDPYGKEFARHYAGLTLYGNFDVKLNNENDAILKFRPFQKLFNTHASHTYALPAEINLNDTALLKTSYIRYFLRTLLFTSTFTRKREVEKNTIWSWDTIYSNIFKMADRLTTPNTLANSLLKANFINTEIGVLMSRPYKEDTTEALYTKYVDLLKDDPLIVSQALAIEKNLQIELNKLGKLKKGAVAPACRLTDEKGNIVGWENFKGKYIYIDVWASWCHPCIGQIPYWNKLVKKYKDNENIVFITISIDDTSVNWKKALLKYKPAGTALLSSGGWESELGKQFNIRSIPANIIIDRDGNMLQQRASKPDSINLDEIIH